jgi:TolB protein
MTYEFDGGEKPPRSPLKTILYAAVVLLIIGGLLASAVAALLWFIGDQSEPSPEQVAIPTSPPPSPTPAPNDDVKDDLVAEPPVVVPTNGINRIVYVSPDGQLATINPDGSDGRILSDTSLTFQFPAWSPDGRYLAAIGGNAAGGGVYLLTDEENGDPAQELHFSRVQSPIYLYWSPDSRQLSFLANHPTDVLGMHLVAVDLQEEKRLLVTGSPLYWDWKAGGEELMIHIGFAGENARLALIDAFGDGQGANIASPGFFQAPGISVDGRFLAYAEEIGQGRSDIIIADTETGSQQQERHAGLVAMGWSPGGDQLAIISGAEETDRFHGPLRLLDAVTGEVRLLSRRNVLAFFWSPDGRYIATVTAESDNDDLNAGIPLQLVKQAASIAKSAPRSEAVASKPSLVQQPVPILLDLSVIEAATGQSRNLSTFQPARGFLGQFLPFFDQYALSHRVWSPDSQSLLFPMHIDGEDRVVVLSVDGKTVRQIADGNMPFWSHQ